MSGTNRFVRCVRRDVVTATFAAPRFAVTEPVAGQPVVTDDRTRLVWQGCAAGASGSACDVSAPGSFSWQAALAACESSTWGGATDWRLPNVVELHSVVDDRRTTAPAIDAAAFPATPSSTWFWSSSTAVASPRFAWYVNFVDGYADWAHQNKGSSHFVRCVRAGR